MDIDGCTVINGNYLRKVFIDFRVNNVYFKGFKYVFI